MGELFERLKNYADSDFLPMHMPGHKRIMREIKDPFFIDLTEIDGFDDLYHAQGILRDAQRRAAALYHSEETHYLVNGSTAGILSAVSGCVSFGGKILLARNSHKSAYHACLLRNLQPQYLYPQSTGIMGIDGRISPADVDDALQKDPDIQAVLVTSPTYDGVVSDIDAIGTIAHAHGKPLIVDEAHGAHFPFSDFFPKDSISCQADAVIHSLHKTLPSLTQTALIHLNGPLIDREKIRRHLAVYQTSSPSYVLMASLDNCVEWISEHEEAFERFSERILKLRGGLENMKTLRLLEAPGMDLSRILVSTRGSGLHGGALGGILRRDHHIELEMSGGSYVCAITTVADTEECLERLCKAFLCVDGQLCKGQTAGLEAWEEDCSGAWFPTESVCTFLEAEEEAREECPLLEAEGRVSADFVMRYPPGIPILAPGERISRRAIEQLKAYAENGYAVHGVKNGSIQALKNKR